MNQYVLLQIFFEFTSSDKKAYLSIFKFYSEPFQDTAIWLILYRCAYRLEGNHTVETLSALYDSGCQMLTSASNILVTAHEAIAKHNKCFVDDVFFFLNSHLAKILKMNEMHFTGSHL